MSLRYKNKIILKKNKGKEKTQYRLPPHFTPSKKTKIQDIAKNRQIFITPKLKSAPSYLLKYIQSH